jgi:hypothetical protein
LRDGFALLSNFFGFVVVLTSRFATCRAQPDRHYLSIILTAGGFPAKPQLMLRRKKNAFLIILMISATHPGPTFAATFGDDVAFLKKHTEIVVLTSKDGHAKAAVAPAWQGRVMTSSADGDSGYSFGWINRELIASGKERAHINARGGEDRFWLGPEGGQFSIFFTKGAPFDLEHWFTPAPIDTMPYHLVSQSFDRAAFTASFSLTNYSGTRFDLKVDRQVRVLDWAETWTKLRMKPNTSIKLVAYETDNEIANKGPTPWMKETGLLSIWILGMFNPSPNTTIIVPIRKGSEAELGRSVSSDYFGEVPKDRLVVKDNIIYFSGDGKFRSKIGVNPKRSKAVIGSYDADHRVMTLVQFSQSQDYLDYVNSLWQLQDKPYGGDAANSYNDGPPSPGAKPLGPFYELESSSPAIALDPGISLIHLHRTIHLVGAESDLDPIAQSVFGVSLAEIKSALPR